MRHTRGLERSIAPQVVPLPLAGVAQSMCGRIKDNGYGEPRMNLAERTGSALGSLWRAVIRSEVRLHRWMASRGVPSTLANSAVLLAKVTILAVLLYVAFWLAVLLVCAIVLARAFRHADLSPETDEPEWRTGMLGFGLYDKDGFRIDPGPDDASTGHSSRETL